MTHQRRQLKKNEVLFKQGDVGDCAYLVETGRILIYAVRDGDEFPLSILGEGEVFGEMALIDNEQRSASARALDACTLVVVNKQQLLDRIQAADTVVRLLMRVLLKRLRKQTEYILGKDLSTTAGEASQEREGKDVLERIMLENKIRDAFDAGEFVPYYQPIYNLGNSELVGCESLMRWIVPGQVQVGPNVFMDIIENSSMVIPFGRWVIERALSDLKFMLAQNSLKDDFFVSINVSGRQFYDPDFLLHLERERTRIGVPAQHIKLEVTERVMMEGAAPLQMMEQCFRHGYKLAIDDFGTGFSSLQYLATMPLHDLKIDRSFVSKIFKDDKSLTIVKSLIFLATHFRLNLIAEGIETPKEMQFLQSLGVQMGQGFLFSKAIPLDQFMKLPSGYKSAA